MDILLAIFPRYLPSILPGMPGTITLRCPIPLQFPYHYYQEPLYSGLLFFIISRHYITKCAFCNKSEHMRFFNNIGQYVCHTMSVFVSHMPTVTTMTFFHVTVTTNHFKIMRQFIMIIYFTTKKISPANISQNHLCLHLS